MKTTLRYDTVRKLVKALEDFPKVNIDMPTDLWIALAETRQKLMPTSTVIDEVNNGLIERFKSKDREENKIHPTDPRWKEFEKASNELFNKTVEIDISTYPPEKLKAVPKLGGLPGVYTLFDYIFTDTPVKDEPIVAKKEAEASPSENGQVKKEPKTQKQDG